METKRKNSMCILCYKPVIKRSLNVHPRNNSERKFLLLLSRHLKIHSKLSAHVKHELLFCEDCSNLGDSFAQLYFQQECIKLKINWKIRRIYETMLLAGRVPSRLKSFQKQFDTSVEEKDDNDSNIQKVYRDLLNLRKDLVKKCKQEITSSVPKVSLKRLGEDDELLMKVEKLSPTKSNVPDHDTITSSNLSSTSQFELLAVLISYIAVLHLSLPLHPSHIPTTFKVRSLSDLDLISDENAQENIDFEEQELCLPPSNHESGADDDDDDIPVSPNYSFDNEETPQRISENIADGDPIDIEIKTEDSTQLQDNTTNQELPENISVTQFLNKNTDSPKIEKESTTFRKSLRALFNCSKCSKTFTNQANLNLHVQTHNELLITSDEEGCLDTDTDDDLSEDGDKMEIDLQKDIVDGNSSAEIDNLEESDLDDELVSSEAQPKAKVNFDKKVLVVKRLKHDEDETYDKSKELQTCDQCPRVFKNIRNLEYHYHHVHPDRSTWKFVCPKKECGGRFASQRRLTLHQCRTEVQIQKESKSKQGSTNECELCHEIFSCEAAVEKHRAVDHKLLKYARCQICQLSFRSHAGLVEHRHKSNHHLFSSTQETMEKTTPQFPFGNNKHCRIFCPRDDCFEVFRFDAYLQTHLKTHGVWNCTLCPEEFTKAHELAAHELNTHNSIVEIAKRTIHNKKYKNLAEFTHHCTRCDWSFRDRQYVVAHFLHVHLDIPEVKLGKKRECLECHICKKKFVAHATEKSMKDHLQNMHNVEGMDPSAIATCTICKAPFTKRMFLTQHLRVEQTMVCKCSHCEKKFKNSTQLRYHIGKYHKGKSSGLAGAFECEDCKEKFSNKRNLELHKNKHEVGDNHNQIVFKCEICGAVFSKKLNLYNHNKNMHKAPKEMVPCEKCGKFFKDITKLRQHTSYVHTDPSEWKFGCPEQGCGKRCWSRQKLTEHIRTHTKERPFVCNFCGESYRYRQYLRTHLKREHGTSAEE